MKIEEQKRAVRSGYDTVSYTHLMAYVPVPKDLTKVKTKVALNLTKRQLIFFSLAAVVGIPFYLVTVSYTHLTNSSN